MKKKFKIISQKTIDETSGQVPLYRSYGVQKKVNPFIIALNVILTRIIVVIVFALPIAIILLCAVFFFKYGGPLLATAITLPVAAIFWHIYTRVARRRWEFLRKLKKLCRENKYRLDFKRGFFKSLEKCNPKGVDFVLQAEGITYYVKYVTPKNPLISVTFLSKNQIRYTKHARKNIFSLVFSKKDKMRIMDFEFPKHLGNDKNIVRAMLVNPMPRDILVKNEDGATVPTGTGENIYGYTIYTGKGFLRAIEESKETRKLHKIIH